MASDDELLETNVFFFKYIFEHLKIKSGAGVDLRSKED